MADDNSTGAQPDRIHAEVSEINAGQILRDLLKKMGAVVPDREGVSAFNLPVQMTDAYAQNIGGQLDEVMKIAAEKSRLPVIDIDMHVQCTPPKKPAASWLGGLLFRRKEEPDALKEFQFSVSPVALKKEGEVQKESINPAYLKSILEDAIGVMDKRHMAIETLLEAQNLKTYKVEERNGHYIVKVAPISNENEQKMQQALAWLTAQPVLTAPIEKVADQAGQMMLRVEIPFEEMSKDRFALVAQAKELGAGIVHRENFNCDHIGHIKSYSIEYVSHKGNKVLSLVFRTDLNVPKSGESVELKKDARELHAGLFGGRYVGVDPETYAFDTPADEALFERSIRLGNQGKQYRIAIPFDKALLEHVNVKHLALVNRRKGGLSSEEPSTMVVTPEQQKIMGLINELLGYIGVRPKDIKSTQSKGSNYKVDVDVLGSDAEQIQSKLEKAILAADPDKVTKMGITHTLERPLNVAGDIQQRHTFFFENTQSASTDALTELLQKAIALVLTNPELRLGRDK